MFGVKVLMYSRCCGKYTLINIMTFLEYCLTFKFGHFRETVCGDALFLFTSAIICVGTCQLLCQLVWLPRGPVSMDEPIFLRLTAGDVVVVVQARWCVAFCDLGAVAHSGVATFLSLGRRLRDLCPHNHVLLHLFYNTLLHMELYLYLIGGDI